MQIKFLKLPAIVRLSQIGLGVFAVTRVIKEEIKSIADRRIEQIAQKHDLIKRGEFEALKSITKTLLTELEQIKKQTHHEPIVEKNNTNNTESSKN